MLVVKFFDVQEELFDYSMLQPLSLFKSCYRFLQLHSQFKKNNDKILEREVKHMPVYHNDL